MSPVLQPDKALSSTAATNLLQVKKITFNWFSLLSNFFFFQHFSLLSPGVFPGWPGASRPPGPTRCASFTFLIPFLENYLYLFFGQFLVSFFSAVAPAQRQILQLRQPSRATDTAARFFLSTFLSGINPRSPPRVGWGPVTTWTLLRSARRATTFSSTTSNSSRPYRYALGHSGTWMGLL